MTWKALVQPYGIPAALAPSHLQRVTSTSSTAIPSTNTSINQDAAAQESESERSLNAPW